MSGRSVIRSMLWIVAWCVCISVAEACPSCKDGLASGPNGSLVRGVFYSIIFMMSMPFLILGGLGTYGYLLVRKARRAQQAVGERVQEPSIKETSHA